MSREYLVKGLDDEDVKVNKHFPLGVVHKWRHIHKNEEGEEGEQYDKERWTREINKNPWDSK